MRKMSAHRLGAAVFAIGLGLVAQSSADYVVSRRTSDGGGIIGSTGTSYTLAASVGQPDAGSMTGGPYDLNGGFWFREPPSDCNATGQVDLLDYEDLSGCLLGPDLDPGAAPCTCLDVDEDGDIDLFDFSEFQVFFAP